MHASMENQASVWIPSIDLSAASDPRAGGSDPGAGASASPLFLRSFPAFTEVMDHGSLDASQPS